MEKGIMKLNKGAIYPQVTRRGGADLAVPSIFSSHSRASTRQDRPRPAYLPVLRHDIGYRSFVVEVAR